MKYALILAASLAASSTLAGEPTLLVSFNPFTGQSPSPHKVIEYTLDGKLIAERADLGKPEDPTDQAAARGVVALADGRFAVVSGTFQPTLRFYNADNSLSHSVRVPGWSYVARMGTGRIALAEASAPLGATRQDDVVLMADEWTQGSGTATGIVAAAFDASRPGSRFSAPSDAPVDGRTDVAVARGAAVTISDDGRVQFQTAGTRPLNIAYFQSENDERLSAVAVEERAPGAMADNVIVGTTSGRILRLVSSLEMPGEKVTAPLLTFKEIARLDTSISDIDARLGIVAAAGLTDGKIIVVRPGTFEVLHTFRVADRADLSVAIRPPREPAKTARAK